MVVFGGRPLKYMGSKQALLGGALGRALTRYTEPARPFVDLFAGSAAVGNYVAEETEAIVTSVDSQGYSSALALSVIDRAHAVDPNELAVNWIKKAQEAFDISLRDSRFAPMNWNKITNVRKARSLCRRAEAGFIVRDYGGHYFSPIQALAFESLLPPPDAPRDDIYWLQMGVIVRVASQVSASPGHTAQPFQPTEKLLPYIDSAWRRDVFALAESMLNEFAPRHAKRRGNAVIADANEYASKVPEGAVVFCDPPYSDVQYSRFYHVLEGISRGGWPAVSGAGRAPDLNLRASSRYSLKTASKQAFDELFQRLSERKATVLLTFPSGDASNGMDGDTVRALARRYFSVKSQLVPHTHSTLGGPANSKDGTRLARRPLNELLLVMMPK